MLASYTWIALEITHRELLLHVAKLVLVSLNDGFSDESAVRDVGIFDVLPKKQEEVPELWALHHVDRLKKRRQDELNMVRWDRGHYLIICYDKFDEELHQRRLREHSALLRRVRFDMAIEGGLCGFLAQRRDGNLPAILLADFHIGFGMLRLEVNPEIGIAGLLSVGPGPLQLLRLGVL